MASLTLGNAGGKGDMDQNKALRPFVYSSLQDRAKTLAKLRFQSFLFFA